MLFREIVTVYYNNTEHTSTLRGQNSESQYVKAGGIYSNRLALKGQTPPSWTPAGDLLFVELCAA
jgi:hypothetical protein